VGDVLLWIMVGALGWILASLVTTYLVTRWFRQQRDLDEQGRRR
jgi:hypothetical protein